VKRLVFDKRDTAAGVTGITLAVHFQRVPRG
jgi:hypothetical protein